VGDIDPLVKNVASLTDSIALLKDGYFVDEFTRFRDVSHNVRYIYKDDDLLLDSCASQAGVAKDLSYASQVLKNITNFI
jgi:hypothetical protein